MHFFEIETILVTYARDYMTLAEVEASNRNTRAHFEEFDDDDDYFLIHVFLQTHYNT